MFTMKQSLRSMSVILLILMTVFISAMFAMYNANLSLARETVLSLSGDAELLAQIDGKASMGNMILVLSMISLGMTSLLSIIMYISRHINENQASMGVLKAMGYRKGQIAKSYILFGIPVLAGAVPGFTISFFLEPAFGNLLNANVVLPDIKREFPTLILGLSVILPLVFFSLFARITASIKLRHSPLSMIRGNMALKTGFLARRNSSRANNRPFLKDLSRSVIRSNLLLLFFVAFAGLAFGNQMQLGFAVSSMTDKALERTLESINYISNVRFIEHIAQAGEGMPYTAVYGSVSIGDDTLSYGELVMFQNGGSEFKLLDADFKKEIDLGTLDGIVVNNWLRSRYNLSLGDNVLFEKDGEIFALPIAAFERSAFGQTIYCSYEFARKHGIIESVGYNGLFTNNVVVFDPERHLFISTIEDMRGEFQEQKETYSTLSVLFFVLGTLIGFITLQIALRLVINANRKYIAMMKAYGYSDAERRHSILGKYRPIAYVGFLIGTGYAYLLLAILFGMTAKTSNMLVPVKVDVWAVLIAPVVFIIAYELMIAIYSRQINKVSLKELMIE